MKRNVLIASGVAGVAVAAYLAFGVFGVQTLFIDDEVDEAGPVFDSLVETDEPTVSSSAATEGAPETTEAADATPPSTEEAAGITRVVEGQFIDLDHVGEGTAVVLTDGTSQRFLRFEDDFAIDNGPDLFVYLVAGVSADGDQSQFDDDFVNLGVLSGNIGSQNYEIPADLDLDVYNTVVIWCRRFGVAFNAADLAYRRQHPDLQREPIGRR